MSENIKIETDGKNLYWISENLESQQIKEPTQEWLDEVEFIRKNYSEKEEWNKKGYIYQPSLLFGGVNKLMSWLQIYMEEDEVWKWLFGTFGVIIVLTLIFAFYVI